MNTECRICLQLIRNNDNPFATRCGHIYHENCIKIWLQNNTNRMCLVCKHLITRCELIRLHLNEPDTSSRAKEHLIQKLRSHSYHMKEMVKLQKDFIGLLSRELGHTEESSRDRTIDSSGSSKSNITKSETLYSQKSAETNKSQSKEKSSYPTTSTPKSSVEVQRSPFRGTDSSEAHPLGQIQTLSFPGVQLKEREEETSEKFRRSSNRVLFPKKLSKSHEQHPASRSLPIFGDGSNCSAKKSKKVDLPTASVSTTSVPVQRSKTKLRPQDSSNSLNIFSNEFAQEALPQTLSTFFERLPRSKNAFGKEAAAATATQDPPSTQIASPSTVTIPEQKSNTNVRNEFAKETLTNPLPPFIECKVFGEQAAAAKAKLDLSSTPLKSTYPLRFKIHEQKSNTKSKLQEPSNYLKIPKPKSNTNVKPQDSSNCSKTFSNEFAKESLPQILSTFHERFPRPNNVFGEQAAAATATQDHSSKPPTPTYPSTFTIPVQKSTTNVKLQADILSAFFERFPRPDSMFDEERASATATQNFSIPPSTPKYKASFVIPKEDPDEEFLLDVLSKLRIDLLGKTQPSASAGNGINTPTAQNSYTAPDSTTAPGSSSTPESITPYASTLDQDSSTDSDS